MLKRIDKSIRLPGRPSKALKCTEVIDFDALDESSSSDYSVECVAPESFDSSLLNDRTLLREETETLLVDELAGGMPPRWEEFPESDSWQQESPDESPSSNELLVCGRDYFGTPPLFDLNEPVFHELMTDETPRSDLVDNEYFIKTETTNPLDDPDLILRRRNTKKGYAKFIGVRIVDMVPVEFELHGPPQDSLSMLQKMDCVTEIILTGGIDIRIEFPVTLRKFVSGDSFNQSIAGLPEGLEFLKLGKGFKQSLFVPTTVKVLILNCKKRLGSLPHAIEVYCGYWVPTDLVFPETLKEMFLVQAIIFSLSKLPVGLKKLGFYNAQRFTSPWARRGGAPKLDVFYFPKNKMWPVGHLDGLARKLVFTGNYSEVTWERAPHGVTHLSFIGTMPEIKDWNEVEHLFVHSVDSFPRFPISIPKCMKSCWILNFPKSSHAKITYPNPGGRLYTTIPLTKKQYDGSDYTAVNWLFPPQIPAFFLNDK